MTKKEEQLVTKICQNADSVLRPQIETVAKSVLAMQTQLEENYNEYITQPLSIEVVKGDGEIISRANPYVQEYRALLKDYTSAIKQLQELTNGVKVEQEMNALVNMKEKFKIAK